MTRCGSKYVGGGIQIIRGSYPKTCIFYNYYSGQRNFFFRKRLKFLIKLRIYNSLLGPLHSNLCCSIINSFTSCLDYFYFNSGIFFYYRFNCYVSWIKLQGVSLWGNWHSVTLKLRILYKPLKTITTQVKGKGKAVPVQAWIGSECPRSFRLSDFKTIGTWTW